MKKSILLSLFCIFLTTLLNAQRTTGKLFVAPTADDQDIRLKWLTKDIISPQGFNVYRSAVGQNNWEKLNTRPLSTGAVPLPASIANDSTILMGKQIADANDPVQLRGMAKINFFTLAVTEADFARYLGIEFTDQTADGGAYDYEVRQLDGSREIVVDRRNNVRASGLPEISTAPEFTIEFDKQDEILTFNWGHNALGEFFAYDLYRSSQKTGATVKVNAFPIIMLEDQQGAEGRAKFSDSGLDETDRYTYALKGIDYLGRRSLESNQVFSFPRTPTPPTDPTGFNYNNEIDHEVTLFWEANPELDVVSYRLSRTPNIDLPFEFVAEINAPLTTYVDRGLDYSYYYYLLQAVDQEGDVSSSINVLTVDATDHFPPATPSGLTATAVAGEINLQWTANPETDLAGYIIFQSTDKIGEREFSRMNIAPIPENQFTERLPKARRNKMIYSIAAQDTSGNLSEKSAAVWIAMPDEVPPTVPFLQSIRSSNDSVYLAWEAVVDGDFSHYRLFRQSGNQISPAFLRRIEANQLDFIDASLASGSKADYQLSAVDTVGNESALSQPMSITLPSSRVSGTTIPLSGKVRKRAGKVILSWPEQAGKIIVFRRSPGGRFAPLTELTKMTGKFEDVPPGGGTYSYRIKSYLPDGKKITSSILTINL